MEIKLISLLIRDWKKIDELKVQFDGKNTNIYGYNETGKTTVYDAFLWLLFGKDSRGRANFDIKPIIDGVTLRDKVSTVSAVLSIDGKNIELTKSYKEKWIKPRGETEPVFDSNVTDYWVNEENVALKVYAAKIAKFIDEKTFRYITNADAFLAQRKEDMRATLIEKAGGIANSEIAGTDPTLVKLAQHLDEKDMTVDGLIKITRDKIKLMNGEIDGIAPRIEEAKRNIPAVKDWAALREKLAANAERQADLAAKLGSGSVSNQEKMIADLEQQVTERIQMIINGSMTLLNDADRQLEVIRCAGTEAKMQKYQWQIEQYKIDKDQCKSEYQTMAKQLADLKASECHIPESMDHCEFCGAALAASKYTELVEALKIKFDEELAENVKRLVAEMNARVTKAKDLAAEIEKQQQLVNELTKVREAELLEIERLGKIRIMADDAIRYPEGSDPAIRTMRGQAAELKAALVPVDNAAILAEMDQIIAENTQINADLAGEEAINRGEARIAELHTLNRELAQKIAGQEKIRDACDRFMRIRTERMTDAINDQYEYVKFRLFDKTNDGTVIDDCTPLVGGVSLYTNASRSQEIRAGLDIIKAIQKSSGITAPVFVDNAESANWLLPMDCQLIKLVVSEQDKTLRVEVEG